MPLRLFALDSHADQDLLTFRPAGGEVCLLTAEVGLVPPPPLLSVDLGPDAQGLSAGGGVSPRLSGTIQSRVTAINAFMVSRKGCLEYQAGS